jgi:nitrate reductase NapE component
MSELVAFAGGWVVGAACAFGFCVWIFNEPMGPRF